MSTPVGHMGRSITRALMWSAGIVILLLVAYKGPTLPIFNHVLTISRDAGEAIKAANERCRVWDHWQGAVVGPQWRSESGFANGFLFNDSSTSTNGNFGKYGNELSALPFHLWSEMMPQQKETLFKTCTQALVDFTIATAAPEYPWSNMEAVRETVVRELSSRNRNVTLALMWEGSQYTGILIPYIIRQLKSQGGIVDRLAIGVIQASEKDLNTIGTLKAKYGNEIAIFTSALDDDLVLEERRISVWRWLFEDTRHIVVRMSSNLTFVQDGAIDQLVLAKLLYEGYSTIGANLVNGFFMPEIHQRLGASWQTPMDAKEIEPVVGAEFAQNYSNVKPWSYYGISYRDHLQAISQHRSFLSRVFSPHINESNVSLFRSHVDCVVKSFQFSIFDLSVCRCTEPIPGFPTREKITKHEQTSLKNCGQKGVPRWDPHLFVVDPKEIPLKIFSSENAFFTSHVPEQLNLRTAILGTAVAVNALSAPQHKKLTLAKLSEEALYLHNYKRLSLAYNRI